MNTSVITRTKICKEKTAEQFRSTKKVRITKAEIEKVCTRYHIPRYHIGCFLRLANEGKITGKAFSKRIHTCGNYKRATKAIMYWLSRSTWFLFDYNRPEMFDKVQRLFAGKNSAFLKPAA